MKIGIDMGHTLSGYDYGAIGIRNESELTREVGTKVISKLQHIGHTVINCTCDKAYSVNDSLQQRVDIANRNNVDLLVSIHFNYFNGKAFGTEIYTFGGKELKEASRILKNIISLGYRNRGIKDGSKLAIIRRTKMKAMLIECCFADNKNDMNLYNAEKFANAIVSGLVGQAPIQNNVSRETLKKGDKVKVKTQYDYNGIKNDNWVLLETFEVLKMQNDRIVIGRNGAITGAWNKKDLVKL